MKLPDLKEMKKSTSLPQIKKKFKILSEESKKELLLYTANSFSHQLDKVREIKIFLNIEFHKGSIDFEFLKDIENEYAEKYLTKMGYLPTKYLIKKILTMKPIESCDFLLSEEKVFINDNQKEVKVLHIYPLPIKSSAPDHNLITGQKSPSNRNRKSMVINKKMVLKNIESVLKITKKKTDNHKEVVSEIKNNNIQPKNDLVFNQENVQNLIGQAKEDIKEAKYFNTKEKINIDLSTQNIRNNYIINKKTKEDNNYNRFYNGRGRISNISKSSGFRNNILNDPKYVFHVNSIENLTNEILEEINEPLQAKVEVIIKDMNYILDHFPIDDFINVGQPEKEKILENDKDFNYKINLDKYEDILFVLNLLHSQPVYKLTGLTLNLIYWVVFGSENNIQIDSNTKQLIFLKILDEIETISEKIENKKILYEVFIPLMIIMIRIEADVYFSRKFENLFTENKKKCMEYINEIITEIFDKHGFMNSFLTITGKSKELKDKMIKKHLPRFKNKLYATSNYIEQIFNNDTNEIFGKNNEKEKDNFSDIITKKEIEQKKNFIKEQKVNYISNFLNKINNNLAKRRLKPIFSLRRRDEKSTPLLNSMINVKRFKSTVLNQIIFKPNNNSMINLENKDNKNINNKNEAIIDNENEEKKELKENELDKIEEKEDVFEINGDIKHNKITKNDLSYKSTKSKVTFFQNDSSKYSSS